MPQTIRLTSNEQELIRKKSIEINKQLTRYMREPFIRITHRDAVTMLLDLHQKGSVTFETLPSYQDDMSSEHERYLTDIVYKHPVIVTEYPKRVKAFYMPVCGSFTLKPEVYEGFTAPDGTQVEYVEIGRAHV